MIIPDYFIKKNFKPKISENPSESLSVCVVIPSFNESSLDKSLLSLANCKNYNGTVEVIVVVNHPENSSLEIIEQSQKSVQLVNDFNGKHGNSKLNFYTIKAFDLPNKHAGVGLARQRGMDEAAFRLFSIDNPNGVIACFDADATCADNYLEELEQLWVQNPEITACSIRYEHPISGTEYPPDIYKGIAGYELHLRYYNQASRYIGFPFSYHTIGSSMACSANTYVKFGGMNRHKAGEDFYFLQKIIPHGNFRELNTTKIIPSPRSSTRVPFGTGRAMLRYLEDVESGIRTYNLQSFLDLIPFFTSIDSLWEHDDKAIQVFIKNLPIPISQFLLDNDAASAIQKVRGNTANLKSFRKRFFLWFDAFLLLKYLNYANEYHYKREPVENEATKLGQLIGLDLSDCESTEKLLERYREKDLEVWNPKF